ncbi:hypothetical protein BOTCAL_0378g00040 [Botryotinia calthae]|uniref:Uncharacterized protein n=1 Tax=Botryotinia calthae TaxID=38488 RepID=A0A4Y8CRH7_9HELO|nr:hypothetical protein BOTCAL_0378g00040 [Botryotinia calthae]
MAEERGGGKTYENHAKSGKRWHQRGGVIKASRPIDELAVSGEGYLSCPLKDRGGGGIGADGAGNVHGRKRRGGKKEIAGGAGNVRGEKEKGKSLMEPEMSMEKWKKGKKRKC